MTRAANALLDIRDNIMLARQFVGNIYRHNYDNVLESVVWFTLQEELEPLLAAVAAAIDPPGAKP